MSYHLAILMTVKSKSPNSSVACCLSPSSIASVNSANSSLNFSQTPSTVSHSNPAFAACLDILRLAVKAGKVR